MTSVDVATETTPRITAGPLTSERFGATLGVSVSQADNPTCAWACPYCSAGRQRTSPRGCTTGAISSDAIIKATAEALVTHADVLETVAVAGPGEPSNHPAFATWAPAVVALAHAFDCRAVLVSNGDAVASEAQMETAKAFDRVWVKWDPGARGGAWQPDLDDAALTQRRTRLAALDEVCIQAVLFSGPGDAVGNASESQITGWLADLASIKPAAVHLSSVGDFYRAEDVQAISRTELARWADLTTRTLGVTVSMSPDRR